MIVTMRLLHLPTAAAVFALCALWCSAALAECVTSPQIAPTEARDPSSTATPAEPSSASGGTRRERNGRIVAPVMVNGRGPYPFVVDTGANRSVLSPGLALELGLTPYGSADVHSIDSVKSEPMVRVDSLRFGGVTLNNAALPLLEPQVLGAGVGLLGVDGMQGKRLRIDFERRCLEIASAHNALPLASWARVHGMMRFGHLVMLRATVSDLEVNVLVDTGSDTSLANNAFRAAVVHHFSIPEAPPTGTRVVTAGTPIVVSDGIVVPRLRMGEITLTNVPAYVGDFHIFDLWGLRNEPTLLIGMDVLRNLRAIAIDYSTATVQFKRPIARFIVE